MNKLIVVAIIIGAVLAIGAAIGLFLFLATHRKREQWNAKLFRLGDGVLRSKVSSDGKTTMYEFKDIRPYGRDILYKTVGKNGTALYFLNRLQLKCPPLTDDYIDYWSKEDKEVLVLVKDGQATYLKKYYDSKYGSLIFRPLSHDRVDLIVGEIEKRKKRLQKEEKNLVSQLAPYIMGAIVVIGLVAIAYFLGTSYVEISENLSKITDLFGRMFATNATYVAQTLP